MATLKVTNIKNESFAGDQLYLKSNGYLGIGTTNPGEELEVSADAPSIQLLSTNASGRKYGFQSMNDGKFGIYDGTAGANRIVLASDGKVGIGTASPVALIHLAHSGTSTGTGTNICASLRSGASGRDQCIQFADSATSAYIGMLGGAIYFADSGSNEKMRILADGKVGIGTTSPGYLLHVKNAGTADTAIKIESESGYDAYLALDSSNGGGAETDIKFQMDGTTKGTISYVNNAGSADVNCMIFRNNANTERMKIKADGDIEVGGNLKTNNLYGRNRITNGDMRVSQRYGTTETTINVNAWHYILDRFKMYQNTDGQATVTQVTSGYAASNTGSGNALRIKVTSADTSLSGSQQLQLTQVIEGFNCEDLRFGTANAKSFTVSFSILATGASAGNVTGTYCVNATNFGNYDRAYVKEYTIDAVDTWKKVTLTFPGCTDGTWGTGNTGGIRLGWFFAGPTSQQGAANQWHTSYKGSTTNQKNGMGVVNNFYFIKDIQVEEGTIATPFERRSYGEELTRCQRYYQQLGSTDANLGGDYAMLPGYTYYNGQRIATSYVSNVKMRTTPTIAEIGNGIAVYGQGTNANVATIFGINTATDTNVIIFTVDGASSKDWGDIDHAMVITNNTGGGMSFSAEL